MGELTQEQIEAIKNIANSLVEIWERLKQAFMKVAESFRRWLRITLKMPGYKRLAKAKELAYYESISKGKSNNWRKYHGLCLIRNNC